jgi:hypothetical protein
MSTTRKRLANRRRLIEFADRQLGAARMMPTDDAGYLIPSLWMSLLIALNEARRAYRLAGFSLLAGRVGFLHRRVLNLGCGERRGDPVRVEVRSMWAFFDRLNEATRLACKEGNE